MRRAVCAVILAVLSGCHPATERRPASRALPDELPATGAIQVDPAILGAGRICDEQQDPRACAQAAEYWEGDDGHAFVPQKAIHYAEVGCTRDDGLACAVLGRLHELGLGTAWDPARAVAAYERACTAGTGLGCARLGAMYEHGHGVDRDARKARAYSQRAQDLWRSACLGDEPRWCTYVAVGPEDRPTAEDLAQRACSRGVAAGCIAMLRAQLQHTLRPEVAALAELGRWCSQGQAAACEELANAHDTPDAIQLPPRSLALLQQACTLGRAETCVRLGMLHEAALDAARDDPAARRYFRRACDRGSAQGCWRLTEDLNVTGASAREIGAVLQRGCELGHTASCTLVARLYRAARADTAAARWATEACRMESFEGCGYLAERGLELPRITSELLLSVSRAACDASVASACGRLPGLIRQTADAQSRLLAAVSARDAVAFAGLVATDVDVDLRSLRFADAGCSGWFTTRVSLAPSEHAAFLRCLAPIGLHVEPGRDDRSPPSLRDAQSDEFVLDVRDDGVQGVTVRPSLAQLGTPIAAAPSAPPAAVARGAVARGAGPGTLSPATLDAHRIAGSKNIFPDPETRTAIAHAGWDRLIGTFKLCISTRGTVTSVTSLKSTRSPAYDRRIERTMYRWKYSPFMLDGEPQPVCSTVTFIYTQH